MKWLQHFVRVRYYPLQLDGHLFANRDDNEHDDDDDKNHQEDHDDKHDCEDDMCSSRVLETFQKLTLIFEGVGGVIRKTY